MAKQDDEEVSAELLEDLRDSVHLLYATFKTGLPFHGWHHVEFVRARAVAYAQQNGANIQITEAAALLHDINYMVRRNSRADAGEDERCAILTKVGFPDSSIQRIERVIREAETEARNEHACLEAQALSDADTIFKALPITPVLLAPRYMNETGRSLAELAEQIVRYQVPLYEQGIYFYNDEVRKQYEQWAEANLRLWQCIRDSLGHIEVRELVAMLEARG